MSNILQPQQHTNLMAPIVTTTTHPTITSQQNYSTTTISKTQWALQSLQYDELLEVIQFFCLDFGCLHLQAEHFLANGNLDWLHQNDDKCNDHCPMCTGSWRKVFVPICWSVLCSFFESGVFLENMPMVLSPCASLSDIIWKSDFWKQKIYPQHHKHLCKATINALFLSLAAAQIIGIESVMKDVMEIW